MRDQLIGTWSGTAGTAAPVPLTVEFLPDSSYTETQTTHLGTDETVHGTYQLVASNELEVTIARSRTVGAAPPVSETLTFTILGDTLILRNQQGVKMTVPLRKKCGRPS